MKNKLVVTVTGPSLSGKTTLARKLEATGEFAVMVSHTTRPMRSGEVNGRDYHFVSESQFRQLDLMESVAFSGARYGLSVAECKQAMESGKVPLVVVEPVGAEQIRRKCGELGWRSLRLFLDIDFEVQRQRFYERLSADQNADIPRYLDRYVTMVHDEQKWRELQWDYAFRNFSPTTEGYIMDNIRNHWLVRECLSAARPQSAA